MRSATQLALTPCEPSLHVLYLLPDKRWYHYSVSSGKTTTPVCPLGIPVVQLGVLFSTPSMTVTAHSGPPVDGLNVE